MYILIKVSKCLNKNKHIQIERLYGSQIEVNTF